MYRPTSNSGGAGVLLFLGIALTLGLTIGILLAQKNSGGPSSMQVLMKLGPNDQTVPNNIESVDDDDNNTPFRVESVDVTQPRRLQFRTRKPLALPPVTHDDDRADGGGGRFRTLAITAQGNSHDSDISEYLSLIFTIQACESATLSSATSATSPDQCLTLYNSSVSSTSNPFALTSNSTAQYYAAIAGLGNFTNLMTRTGRQIFSNNPTTLVASSAGNYQYIIVTWFSLIGINGKIPLPLGPGGDDGTVLRTTTGSFSGTNTWNAASSLSVGAQVRNFVQTGITTAWTRLMDASGNSFSLNQTTIANGCQYKLNLYLNTNRRFKGTDDRTGCTECNIVEGDAAGAGMSIVNLDLTAVMTTNLQAVGVETYEGTPVPLSDNPFKILLQLYYIIGEPQRPVHAMHTDTLYQNTTNAFVMTFPVLRYVKNSFSPGSAVTFSTPLDFLSWDQLKVPIHQFTRSDTVGVGYNATINCATGYFVTASCTNGLSFNATFVLTSRNSA